MATSPTTLARRAARFQREAMSGPPPIPQRKMAWAGGKIASNKDAALKKFVERKGGEENFSAVHLDAAKAAPPAAQRARVLQRASGNAEAKASEHSEKTVSKSTKVEMRLRSKLEQIEALEAKQAAGHELELNQIEKIGRKQLLLAQLAAVH